MRRHFTFGRAAAERCHGGRGGERSTESRDFYDDEAFNDRRFFTSRDASRESSRTPAQASGRPPASSASVGETEMRVPLQADDSVVVKRGEGGQDEIIIRRPRPDERSTS